MGRKFAGWLSYNYEINEYAANRQEATICYSR